MDMLCVTDLYKHFGEKQVLNGLNLSVPEHSIYGFIGKNGSGKTTTMKAVLGLLTVDSGTITVCGEKVAFGQTMTNRNIGYLPDVPEFYSFMNAREYLTFCGQICGMEKKDIADRSEELLYLVGLADVKQRIKGYSRGMKQRLGIAQAVFNRPKLLICDEPTSALDPIGRREILDILSSITDQTTILFSTHILSDAERICTDVAFLDSGRVTLSGKLSEIKTKYRKHEYQIQTESTSDAEMLVKTFAKMKRIGNEQVVFCESDYLFSDVLYFISEKGIPVLKIERSEPTLEDLFVKVTDK